MSRQAALSRGWLTLTLALAATWLTACGGGDDGGGSIVVPPPPAAVASLDLTAASAEPPVGTPVPVTAHARDASGSPVAGARVEFAVAASSGSVSPTSQTTDSTGAASTTWTVATAPGQQTLTARSGAISDDVTVSAVPGPPASLAAESPTAIRTDVDATLTDAAAVVSRDQYGNPTPDVEVAFQVVAGGGSANPSQARTDSAGRASTTWTMGPAPGENRLNVVVGDLEPVAFVATAFGDELAIWSATQERWPESDEITVEGRRMELISSALVTIDGAPPAEIVVLDSSRAVIRQPPLPAAQAAGCALERRGQLAVVAPGAAFSEEVRRRHGPIAVLEVGEEQRFDSNDLCLRISVDPSSRYILAAVDRSYIDSARVVSERWHYNGGEPFRMLLADSTDRAAAPKVLPRAARPAPSDPSDPAERMDPSRPSIHDLANRRPDHVRVHDPTLFNVQGDVYNNATPYKVGDEFEWFTIDRRTGNFRVMGLYPPNVVFAVFVDDMPELWDDARALAMDSLFNNLGSPQVQELYEETFGEGPSRTSPHTGQMLVMFDNSGPDNATGLNYSADNYRESSVHFRRNPYWDDNSWYYSLVAHEFGHAWQYRAIGRVSAVWSGEGIANWIAEERLRVVLNLDLDANHNAHVELAGWPLRLPQTGDFVAGYRESHPFLRFLVTRLVFDQRQSYADAVRRVVVGAAEGWHGRYFTAYDRIAYDPAGGLTNRMRQVVDNWDPVDARLDWMLAFALDDRSGLSGDPSSLSDYRIPFVRNAFQHYGPEHSFRLGSGESIDDQFAAGGNYWFEMQGEGALHITADETSAPAGVPSMAWKLVRWR